MVGMWNQYRSTGDAPPTSPPTRTPPTPPTSCDGSQLTVQLTTDQYYTETGWTVTKENGGVVMSNPTLTANEQSTTSECLSKGCYVFEITDSFGDGICCAYGEGSFSVIRDGIVIFSGGEFTDKTSVNFCVAQSTSTSEPSESPTASPLASPSASPTKSITESPVKLPTAEPLDDPNWVFTLGNGKERTCNWVRKRAKNRCKKRGASSGESEKACDACLAACIDYPCPIIPPCDGDNSEWVKGKKDCNWVADKPSKRCKKMGEIDGQAVRACIGCCDTCSDIPFCA